MTIPTEMTILPQWCAYKLEMVDGRRTKVPYEISTGARASSINPTTWTTFSAAQAAYQDIGGYDGICFMLSEAAGIVFIDLDHCIKDDGTIEPWASEIVERFKSYTEKSQSGKGLHILIRGSKPGNKCRTTKYPHAVEIYNKARQCCTTGNTLDGYETIESRQDELDKLYVEIFGQDKPKDAPKPAAPTGLSDKALIGKAFLARNGDKFKQLWDGSWLGYPSQSEADQALMNMLAYWTGKDPAQMERLFSQSGLGKRDKWTDRPDYRKETIEKAIADVGDIYEPKERPNETLAEPDVSFSGYTCKLLFDVINNKRKKALEHPKVLAALAEMRKTKPDVFNIFCMSLEKKAKLKASTVISCLNAHVAMGGTAPENVVPCDIKELIGTFKKWLYIAEDYNITGPFAGIIANFCEGSPDIIGIIGPSGSTKTEFIRALGETQNQYVYPISTITEHTLVSGHKDSNDLVPLLNGRILTIKDLTSILARKEDVRAAIFADFRELTDEYIRKEFGNGIAKEYHDIHSSILFASTNAIERYYSMYSNLGQRMIFIRPRNDPKEARKRAAENRGKQKEMRAELREVTMRFIASMIQAKDERGLPITSEEVQEEMGILYDFLALARTTIHHDFKTGEMDELPEPEFPTRIANTVGRLMEVHALFYGREEVNAEDVAFGCRILTDNIPTTRWRILNALTKEWQHTSKISLLADLPTRSVKYHLDELVALKLAEKLLKDEAEDSMDRRFDYFKLSDSASEAIEIYDTRIRIKGTIEEEQSKILDKQNILLSNPCVISPQLEGEGETLEESKEEPTLGKIPRPTPVKCAQCGEDLTGKGTVERGGKFYCPKPGCGYDPREAPQ